MTAPKALCPHGHDIKGVLRTGMGIWVADEVTLDGEVEVELGGEYEWFEHDESDFDFAGERVFLCWGGAVFLESELVPETERERVAHDAAATAGIYSITPRVMRLTSYSQKGSELWT